MLEIREIKKKYRNFSLHVEELTIGSGAYFMLLGPTGSGKTLLLSIIAGLIVPDGGSILSGGRDITGLNPEDRGAGIVYQDSALFPHLDAGDNIGFGLRMRGIGKKEARRSVEEIMKKLGIHHLYGRSIHGLSGGEKQRVAMARALIIRPDFLLFDEPFSSLDYMTRQEMIFFIKQIRKEYNPTIFHITHDFEEALMLADTVSVIRGGRIVQTGPVGRIFRYPSDPFVAGFVGAKNVFSGKIAGQGDDTVFMTDEGVRVYLGRDTDIESRYIMVREDDIILTREKAATSATNVFEGSIEAVVNKRGINEVSVNIGASLNVYITNRSLADMDLKTGDTVFVVFKGSAVHVF